MWYDDDLYPDGHQLYECPSCDDKEDILSRSRKLTYDIVFNLYNHKVQNINELDDLVEELCSCLGVKMPITETQEPRKYVNG